MKTLSVVVPCYNEEKNIPLLVERFYQLMGTRTDVEVLFVDNGSVDNTCIELKKNLALYPENNFLIVSLKINEGYGHGILSGLKAAKNEILCWTHADMQTDPQDILLAWRLLLSKSEEGKYIVKGRRIKRNWSDSIFTFGMGLTVWLMLKIKISDINAQPKLFPRSFFLDHLIQAAPSDFSLDLFLLLESRKFNYQILEVPVIYRPRLFEEAKGGGGSLRSKWKLLKRTFTYILRLRKKSLSH